MSDYSRQDNFDAKNGTIIYGADVDAEFDAVLTAVNSKIDESREGVANGVATLGAGVLIPAGISGTPLNGGGQLPEASTTALGAVELATGTELTDLTDPLRVITPLGMASILTQAAGSGLSEASGVLAIDFNELGAETTIATTDYLMMIDVTDNGSQKITLANLETQLQGDLLHDSFSDFVADEHIAHSGVSVIAASGGLAATNNDLTSNIGLSIDISTLTELSGTSAIDLDADHVLVADAGTEKFANAAVLVTPEVPTAVAGTTDTLAETDFGKLIQYSNTGTTTVTLPNGLKTGFWATLMLTGSGGTLTLSATTTLNTANSFTSCTTQYGVVTVFHLGSNVWTAWGQLES